MLRPLVHGSILLIAISALTLATAAGKLSAVDIAADGATVESVSVRLRQALDDVRRSLTGTPHAAAWNGYLRLDELASAIDADLTVDGAARAVVVGVQDRLHDLSGQSPSPGITALRTALDRFVAARCRLPADVLANQARALPAETRYYKPDELVAARAQLLAAISALEKKLAEEPHGEAWKKFLRWPELTDALAAADDGPIVLPSFFELRSQSKVPGADSAEFAALRKAIREHRRATAFPDDAATRAEVQAQAEKLAAAIEAWQKGDAAGTGDLAATFYWWARRGEHAEFLADVRRTIERPNLLVDVSAPFLTQVAREDVDRTSPVRDNILDTDIFGTGHTVAVVGVRVLPDADRAAFELTFAGRTDTDTVGYNGPIRIFSRGLTNFTGAKRLWFDASGLHTADMHVRARTTSATKGLCTTLPKFIDPLVRRIAGKQIRKKKSQADWIASRHAEQQIGDGFDRDADVELADAQHSYDGEFLLKLMAAGHNPRRLDFSTTADALRVTMLHGPTNRLAATTAPPQLSADGLVEVTLHESAINHLALALVGGRNIDNTELENDPTAEGEDADEAWSITFNAEEPIKVTFGDDTFSIKIRGDQFTSDDKIYRGMDIGATYKVDRTGGKLLAVRQGELAIFPPDFVSGSGKRLSIGQQTIRKILERKLGAVLKPELRLDDPLELPDDLKGAGPLRPVEFVPRNGWLAVRLAGADAE
jgi:hypothetical protein